MSKRKNIFPRIILYGVLALLSLTILYPFWYIFVVSIMPYDEYLLATRQAVLLWPKEVTWEAYEFVFTESDFIQSFLSTIIITLVGTVLSLTVTTVAAYVVSKTELKGIKLITGLFVFTMIFNGGMIPTYLVVNQMHMLDTLWSCMIPNLINTFYLIIMRTFFMDFPKSLEEAARIEGCTDVGILFRIVIPLSRTIIVAIGLFYAVDRWNEFFSGLLYIQDTSKQPLQVLLYRLIKPGGNSMLDMSLRVDKVVLETARMAGVVIAFAPIALLYPFLQKYFTKGIMVGAVKE